MTCRSLGGCPYSTFVTTRRKTPCVWWSTSKVLDNKATSRGMQVFQKELSDETVLELESKGDVLLHCSHPSATRELAWRPWTE
jgi:hypothetical protein